MLEVELVSERNSWIWFKKPPRLDKRASLMSLRMRTMRYSLGSLVILVIFKSPPESLCSAISINWNGTVDKASIQNQPLKYWIAI